jgi:DNA-binding GntR family transcriptional regulator
MEEATKAGDLERYHPLNLRFHDTLVGFANNPKLLQMYRRLVNELNLYRRHSLALRDRLPTSTKEHRRILDAIAGGDVEGAGRMLHDHAMASRVRMHTLPAAAALHPPPRAATTSRAAPAASPTKPIPTRRATTPKPRAHVAERVIKAS